MIDNVQVRRELSRSDETVAVIEGSIGGRAVEGTLDEIGQGVLSDLIAVARSS